MKNIKCLKKVAITAIFALSSLFLGHVKTDAATIDNSLKTLNTDNGVNVVIIGNYMFDLNSHYLILDDVVRASITLDGLTGGRAVYYLSDATGTLVWTELLTDKVLTPSQINTAKSNLNSHSGGIGFLDLVPIASVISADDKKTEIKAYYPVGKNEENYTVNGINSINTLKDEFYAQIDALIAAYDETVTGAESKLNTAIANAVTATKSKIDLVPTKDEELEVASIMLNTSAVKSSIKVGELLSLTNLTVTLTHKNGSITLVNYADFTTNDLTVNLGGKINPTTSKGDTVGNSTVTVTYSKGAIVLSKDFIVSVTMGDAITISENIIGTYTLAQIGDSTLTLSGLHRYFDEGIALEYRLDLNNTGFTGDYIALSNYNPSTKVVTIIAAGINENTKVQIRVKENADKYVAGNPKVVGLTASIDSIALTSNPNKNTYKYGEEIDLTGIVITATRGTEQFTVNVDKSNVDFGYDGSLGTKNVKVWVDGKYVQFSITVVKADGEAPIEATVKAEFVTGSSDTLIISGVPEIYETSTGGNKATTLYVEFEISYDGGSVYTPIVANITDNRGLNANDGTIVLSSLATPVTTNSKLRIVRAGTTTINRGEPKTVNVTVKESINFVAKATSTELFKHGYTLKATDFTVTKTNADGSTSVITISDSNISLPSNQGLKLVKTNSSATQNIPVTITVNGLSKTVDITVAKADGPEVIGNLSAKYADADTIVIYGLNNYVGLNDVTLKVNVIENGTKTTTGAEILRIEDDGSAEVSVTRMTNFNVIDVEVFVAYTNTHADGTATVLYGIPALLEVIDVTLAQGLTGITGTPRFVSSLNSEVVTYTWYKTTTPTVDSSWVKIVGQTAATLPNSEITLGTSYKLVVTGVGATVGEVMAEIVASAEVSNVTLALTASGLVATPTLTSNLGNVSYTWYTTTTHTDDSSWVVIDGENDDTLSTSVITTTDSTFATSYKVVVTGITGTTGEVSDSVTQLKPEIDTVTFTGGNAVIVWEGGNSLGAAVTYKWQVSSGTSDADYSDIAGQTSQTLTLAGNVTNNYYYRVLVTVTATGAVFTPTNGLQYISG